MSSHDSLIQLLANKGCIKRFILCFGQELKIGISKSRFASSLRTTPTLGYKRGPSSCRPASTSMICRRIAVLSIVVLIIVLAIVSLDAVPMAVIKDVDAPYIRREACCDIYESGGGRSLTLFILACIPSRMTSYTGSCTRHLFLHAKTLYFNGGCNGRNDYGQHQDSGRKLFNWYIIVSCFNGRRKFQCFNVQFSNSL